MSAVSLGFINDCVYQSDPSGLNVRDMRPLLFFLSLYIWVIFYRINKKGPGNEKI